MHCLESGFWFTLGQIGAVLLVAVGLAVFLGALYLFDRRRDRGRR